LTTLDVTNISRSTDDIISIERAPKLDEPDITISWVESVMAREIERFGKFWKKCKKADTFFLGEFEVRAADDGTKIHLGTAESIIKTLVQHVTPPFLDISVPPPGPRGQSRAEQIEKFLRGANHRLEQDTPTRKITAQHQALYGVAWEKTEFALNRWSEFPEPPEDSGDIERYKEELEEVMEKRAVTWPVISKAVNPQMMVWDVNNGNDPRWLICFYDIDVTWVRAHFPDWDGAARDGQVQFVEAWTHSQVAYLAEKRFALDPQPHGYHTLPWTMHWPQTGLATIGNKPEHLYRGILDGNFEMIEAESMLASRYIDIVDRYAWPSAEWSGPESLVTQAQSDYDKTPGAENYLPPNVERKIASVPTPPQELSVAQGMLASGIEANTAPRVVQGQRPTGAASGYETAVLSGIARLNFEPYVEAAQRALQRRNEIILHIVEHVIQDRVTVWGKTEAGTLDASITPKVIRGHVVNFVQLNPTSSEEQERKINLWASKWREGYVDHDTALRKGGVSNALEVQAKLLSEKFMQSEIVQMALQQAAATRIPLIQQILEATEGGTGSAQQAQEIADNILNTQGSTQLPNAGNFGPGNQAGTRPQTPGTGTPTTTRPVIPGGLREADLIARQISSPARSGPQRVPTSDLPAGMGR